MTAIDADAIGSILDQLYAWSRARGYRGYNKHDGLNSPVLRGMLGWGKWPRLVAIQGVMRFPYNLRPLLAVPRTYNPKGLALFVQGLLARYRLTGNAAYLSEAEWLLDLLHEIRSPGSWSGDCWGYHYPWQDPGFYAPSRTPNAVVTAFVSEAFLNAFRATGREAYLRTVQDALGFLLNDLPRLKDEPNELCLGYMPMPMSMRVMDVSILVGAVAAQYGALSGEDQFRAQARRLVNYVVGQQTEYGAWFYTDPPGDSHIRHDNYHTGFILDALQRYMDATGEHQWLDAYQRGLEFYGRALFNADGAPRWMSDRDYPHDIHGAAQGILTLSRHLDRYAGQVEKILRWSIERMYRPEGRFRYQETRWFRKGFTLMRWCNAWMAYALASWLERRELVP